LIQIKPELTKHKTVKYLLPYKDKITTSDINYMIILRTAATNYKLNKNKPPKYKTNLNVTKLETVNTRHLGRCSASYLKIIKGKNGLVTSNGEINF